MTIVTHGLNSFFSTSSVHSISANVWCSITFFHCLIVMREVICESKMANSVRKLLLVLLLYIGELAIFQSLFHVLEKYCFLSNQYYYRSLRYFFIFTWIAKIVCFLFTLILLLVNKNVPLNKLEVTTNYQRQKKVSLTYQTRNYTFFPFLEPFVFSTAEPRTWVIRRKMTNNFFP